MEIEAYDLRISNKLLNIDDFTSFDRHLHDVLEHKSLTKQLLLSKKLASLKQNNSRQCKNKNEVQFIPDLVINQSSEVFTDNELKLLNKGLNFAPKPKDFPIKDIKTDLESGIYNLDYTQKHEIRSETAKILPKFKNCYKNNNEDFNTIKSLKQREIYYTKSDKGNNVVILDKLDYDQRIFDLINNGTRIHRSAKSFKYVDIPNKNSSREI